MTSEHETTTLRPEQATIPPGHSWNRLPIVAGAIAVLGIAGCAILGPGNPKQFYFSWLVAFLFFQTMALGGLFFVLIMYAAQGGWGIVVRRIAETVFSTIPLMAILFLPVVFGMFALNRLPMHHHPLFKSRVFEHATDDAFFISIESWDPRFDPAGTRTLLESLGARTVELLESE